MSSGLDGAIGGPVSCWALGKWKRDLRRGPIGGGNRSQRTRSLAACFVPGTFLLLSLHKVPAGSEGAPQGPHCRPPGSSEPPSFPSTWTPRLPRGTSTGLRSDTLPISKGWCPAPTLTAGYNPEKSPCPSRKHRCHEMCEEQQCIKKQPHLLCQKPGTEEEGVAESVPGTNLRCFPCSRGQRGPLVGSGPFPRGTRDCHA